tara:strand:+ start:1080 stop:1871 length:792 start_codon:yes stop_codon:yes gene_type:complete
MVKSTILTSLAVVFIFGAMIGGASLGAKFVALTSDEDSEFSISVDSISGTNYYTLIEVDEGDNDEEKQVTYINHNFTFSSLNGGAVTWDFGDGNLAIGDVATHEYQNPGIYSVLAMSIGSSKIETESIVVIVHLEGLAEVDNMECECAPTAKDTVIDLVPPNGMLDIRGYLVVEHDGSSESCSLRNPLQECHLRVIIQKTEEGSLISEEVIFDDNFRSNEKVVDFEMDELAILPGQGIQIRLETDQLRDWHKPSVEWEISIIS